MAQPGNKRTRAILRFNEMERIGTEIRKLSLEQEGYQKKYAQLREDNKNDKEYLKNLSKEITEMNELFDRHIKSLQEEYDRVSRSEGGRKSRKSRKSTKSQKKNKRKSQKKSRKNNKRKSQKKK